MKKIFSLVFLVTVTVLTIGSIPKWGETSFLPSVFEPFGAVLQ